MSFPLLVATSVALAYIPCECGRYSLYCLLRKTAWICPVPSSAAEFLFPSLSGCKHYGAFTPFLQQVMVLQSAPTFLWKSCPPKNRLAFQVSLLSSSINDHGKFHTHVHHIFLCHRSCTNTWLTCTLNLLRHSALRNFITVSHCLPFPLQPHLFMFQHFHETAPHIFLPRPFQFLKVNFECVGQMQVASPLLNAGTPT